MSSAFPFRSAALTDVGLKRKINEDSVVDRPEIGLWAVADGMGGHGGGDVASQRVAKALADIAPPDSAAGFLDAFEASMVEAHDDLRELAKREGRKVVGSTLAALLIYDSHFACVWCGDSRVYMLRAGALTQVSHDHSEVQELIDRGTLNKREAKSWPRANVVTRAVGATVSLELEIIDRPASTGDRFLICSDGLSAHVEDEEIAAALAGDEPTAICDGLVALTLQRGARDNVSVVVIFCG
jgi:serine/threonine protein phosphatase PrpC